jgi:glycerol-3-phosphate O-acyltransferase
LKFDFFFAGRDEFIATIDEQLTLQDTSWKEKLRIGGATAAAALLAEFRPLTAHIAVRSFIEAYYVVADVLAGEGEATNEAQLLERCLAVSRQMHWQGRVTSSESVSRFLLRTGVQLAAHRGLLDPDDSVAGRRRQFEQLLRDLLARLQKLSALSAGRVAELIDASEGQSSDVVG